jgi:hypothetical protein
LENLNSVFGEFFSVRHACGHRLTFEREVKRISLHVLH